MSLLMVIYFVYSTELRLTLCVADIVRARVRTFGVEEHKFIMENGMHG